MADTNSAVPGLTLPGSSTARQYKRLCSWCDKEKPTESGVEMGKGQWKCGQCWIKQARRPAAPSVLPPTQSESGAGRNLNE
jgi:hypothetical protein